MENNTQFKAGQVVSLNGELGVTTDIPRKRSPQIPVMFIGAHYPVLAPTDELILVKGDIQIHLGA